MLKALLDQAAGLSEFEIQSGEHQALHPGQTAQVTRNGVVIGYIGAMHPSIQQALDINQTVYLF